MESTQGKDLEDGVPHSTRRDFVALVSIGALGSVAAAAAGQSFSSKALAPGLTLGGGEPAELSVGLVEGSESFASFGVLPWEARRSGDDAVLEGPRAGAPRVIPAAEVSTGDQSLVHTHIALRVHGVYPDVEAWWRLGIEKVELQVLYRSHDPLVPGPFPFFAWSYDGRPVPMPAQRVRFVAPIDENGSLDLVLRVRRVITHQKASGSVYATGVVARQHSASFTVDWQEGRPKLQRGVYLLGLGASTWSRAATLPGPGERVPAELASLVMSVEPLLEELGEPA